MAFVDLSVVQDVSVVNLGSLALLRPLLDKLNVAGIIDRHLPCNADISHGAALDILLAARLHSPTALVNVAEWASEHGVEYLWNVPADKLNDDRLARALDAFFEKRHAILADITRAALQPYQPVFAALPLRHHPSRPLRHLRGFRAQAAALPRQPAQ